MRLPARRRVHADEPLPHMLDNNRAVTAQLKHPAVNNRIPYAPAIALGAALAVFGW